MAYLGLRPVTQTLATASQILSGDGSTRSFTLQQPVGKSSDIVVSVAREIQIPEADYTANGTVLLFAEGRAPANASNNISVTFVSGALNTIYLAANSFPAGTTTAPAINSTGALTTGIYWPTTSSLGLVASGNARVTISDAAAGVATSTTTGALRVNGGLGLTGAAFVGGQLTLQSGLNATSQIDGALVIDGGLGASGDFFLGGTMTISGGLTVAGAFNTTATNSLTVNTPFVFLANTNVGDAVDQGLVGTYNDGFTQRYTGIYRAASDGHWKLFKNLDNQPTTLVDSGNVSFQYADLWMGNANITTSTQSTTSTTGALTVYGGIGARGSFYVNSLNSAIAIGNGGTSGVGNIGASGAAFNTIFAKATTAQYADLAEKYLTDDAYAPGTVLEFGGKYEVTLCDSDMTTKVAGVVSTKPGFLLNENLAPNELEGQKVVELALTGRVPTRVRGPIKKGDLIVSAGAGYARAEGIPQVGTVIGKALEDFNGDEGVIEVVIGKH